MNKDRPRDTKGRYLPQNKDKTIDFVGFKSKQLSPKSEGAFSDCWEGVGCKNDAGEISARYFFLSGYLARHKDMESFIDTAITTMDILKSILGK